MRIVILFVRLVLFLKSILEVIPGAFKSLPSYACESTVTSLVDKYIVELPPICTNGNMSLLRLRELVKFAWKDNAIVYALASRLNSSFIAGNTFVLT